MIPENNKTEIKENFFETLSNSWSSVLAFILVWWLFSLGVQKLFPIAYIYCVLIVLFICIVITLLRISSTLSHDYEEYVKEYEENNDNLVAERDTLAADNEILKTNFETIKTDLGSVIANLESKKSEVEQLQNLHNENKNKISEWKTEYDNIIADLQQQLKAKNDTLAKLQQDNLVNLPKLKQWEKLKDFWFLVECEIEPIVVMKWTSFINTINPKKQRLIERGVDLSFLPEGKIKDAKIVE